MIYPLQVQTIIILIMSNISCKINLFQLLSSEDMFVEETPLIKIPKNFYSIKTDTAFDSSYVMLYALGAAMFQDNHRIHGFCLMHFRQEVIANIELEQKIDDFLMVDPERMVYVLRRQKKMVLFNIRTLKEQRKVDWGQERQQQFANIYFFNETRLIVSLYTAKAPYRLDYFDTNLNSVFIEELPNQSPVYDMTPSKGNNRSMIVWTTKVKIFKEMPNLVTYELQKQNGLYISKIIPFDLDLNPWRYQFRQFGNYLIGIGSKGIQLITVSISLVDHIIQKYTKHFEIQDKSQLQKCPQCLIRCYQDQTQLSFRFMKNFIYLTSHNHASIGNGQKIDIKNYFIELDPSNMRVVAEQIVKKDQIFTYSVPTNEQSLLQLEFKQEGQDKIRQKMLIRKITVISAKDQFMQMLLHLNEDFDDDLLLDALRLLTGID